MRIAMRVLHRIARACAVHVTPSSSPIRALLLLRYALPRLAASSKGSQEVSFVSRVVLFCSYSFGARVRCTPLGSKVGQYVQCSTRQTAALRLVANGNGNGPPASGGQRCTQAYYIIEVATIRRYMFSTKTPRRAENWSSLSVSVSIAVLRRARLAEKNPVTGDLEMKADRARKQSAQSGADTLPSGQPCGTVTLVARLALFPGERDRRRLFKRPQPVALSTKGKYSVTLSS